MYVIIINNINVIMSNRETDIQISDLQREIRTASLWNKLPNKIENWRPT